MVAIFASATALLTPEFVGSFEPEKLAAKFVQVEKETGVKFNKTNSTFNIVGHWDAIQIAHKSLKKLVITLENAPPPTLEYDDGPDQEPQSTQTPRSKKAKSSTDEDAGASERVIPIKGNPKRGRYTYLDPAKISGGVPDPVIYFQYQDRSYMSEEVLNLDALLDAFEDNMPDTMKVKKEDLKKILEKNTENMGRPLEKRKAYIQAQAALKAKELEQQQQGQIQQGQSQDPSQQQEQYQAQQNQSQLNEGEQQAQQQQYQAMQQQGQQQQQQQHQAMSQDLVQQLQLQQGAQPQALPQQHELHDSLSQQVLSQQQQQQSHLQQSLPHQAQSQQQHHQQPQYQETGHLNGELAGIPNHQIPVMATTREEIEAIDSAQASIEEALASMDTNIVPNNSVSLENSVANPSKSAEALLTSRSVIVNSWAENKYPDSTQVKVDNETAHIKDEIPSSDDDFGGETDDDLSYLDMGHVVTSHETAEPVTSISEKSPEKPKETAEKPKGKGSKRGRKGKDKKVKQESEPVHLDTSNKQAAHENEPDESDIENVGKRRSRRKSKPSKFVAAEGDADQTAEQEDIPPPKKKGLRVRKVQVIKKRRQKSKKRPKTGGQDGSSHDQSDVNGKQEPVDGSEQKIQENNKSQNDSQKLGRPKSNKVYKCTECDYVSQRRTRWTEHMGRVHGFITERDLERQKKPEFPCDQCDKSFIFEKDLKRHMRIVHTAVSYFCSTCQKTYKSKYVYDKHVATHEEGYVQPMFTCQVCPRSFTTKFMLAHHIKSEHLGIKKTYLCPTCGKSFSQIRSYRQHANVHAGIRPFVCETCGKSFTYEKSLKEHRYMHDNLRRFPCKVCGKAFRQYTCLIIHMKVHKETKDHICASCGKGFTQRQSLIRHERIHTGDKPYTCAVCQKSFSDYAVIRKHMMMCHKRNKEDWKDHIIMTMKKPQSNHYISGGPGYIPRDQSTKISDYVKPSDATMVQTANLEPGQPVPHMPGQILPVLPAEEADTNANTSLPHINSRTNDELFRKVVLADEDAQTALSKLTAVYTGANLYGSSNLIQPQEIQLTSEAKPQQTSQEQSQITLMPLNYSVSQNYASAVNVSRPELSEEAIAHYLKTEICPNRSQSQKDVYTPMLAPLSSVVPISDSQRGQVTLTTPTSGDSVISQAALSAWGYAGYPAYYTPANFVQYQGQQN